MGVSIGSASGCGYYAGGGGGVEEEAPQSYYTKDAGKGDEPGRWAGRLAAELGLSGEVTFEDMEPVYTEFKAPDGSSLGRAPFEARPIEARMEEALKGMPDALPEEVDALRARLEASSRGACLAEDLCFSPPKSFTVLVTAARRAENEAREAGDEARADAHAAVRARLEGALWTANEAAMEYTAQTATARAGSHKGTGGGYWVAAPDHVRASFHQSTARPVRGKDGTSVDPQEHIHNVILNRVRCEDGEIRALDTMDLRGKRAGISAVADRILSEELHRMGVETAVREDGVSWEVLGVDQETMDLFSQRRAAGTKAMAPIIAAAEEKYGRPLTALEVGRIRQNVMLFSRVAKDGTESDLGALLDDWQRRLVEETGRGLVPVAERTRAAIEARDARLAAGEVDVPTEWSPEAVKSAALAAVQAAATKAGTWNKADLMLELSKVLPPMPEVAPADSARLLDRLAQEAIEKHATQVSGRDSLPSLGAETPGLGFVRPSSVRYAAPETLLGEQRIREAAVTRGRHAIDAAAVDEWLTANYPTIGPDQRAAVLGLAGTDAALSMLVGPAGTGKSFATGAFAQAWGDLSGGGKVQGLTVSKVAAHVLREDGVKTTASITGWLAAQEQIAAGRPLTGVAPGCDTETLAEFVLSSRDVLVVDEASMVSTTQFDRIRALADAVGAKVVAAGDPEQLGAVDAGGAMELLAEHADTFTLSDVRRFSAEWEGRASLALREGRDDALRAYDAHGRLLTHEGMDEAVQEAARAAAADRLAGKDTIVVAGTNEQAGLIAGAMRDFLVAAGVVQPEGVPLGRDGTIAGVGDEVMTRQIDRGLGVLNRQRFTVTGVEEDGGLRVVDRDGVERTLPVEYVAEHVQSGYASTVHAAQGMTVDVAHFVTDGRVDWSALYVALTRGREANIAHVATTRPDQGPQAKTSRGGTIEVEEGASLPSAMAVLRNALSQERMPQAATVALEQDDARERGAAHLLGRLEAVTQMAVRDRLERHLDEMTGEGRLSIVDRARLCTEQGTAHLARVLRAIEQSGADPKDALREALNGRPLTDAASVSQVLSHRLGTAHDPTLAAPGRQVPGDVAESFRAQLEAIRERLDDRARVLGSELSQEPPRWAVEALGPVPEEAVGRLEWEARAGAVAVHREGTGWTDERRPIDHAPGITTTERRGSYWEAWEALGRPEATREEAGLTDGQLQVRVKAWERAREWAPPHADDALRASSQHGASARREAVLARSIGDEDLAVELEAAADRLDAVARGMERVAAGRSAWAEDTAETRSVGERAAAELRFRGMEPGDEPDRTTPAEWFAAELESRAAEDEHRDVTEADLIDPAADEVREMDRGLHGVDAPEVDMRDVELEPAREPEPAAEAPGQEIEAPEPAVPSQERAPIDPTPVELEALVGVADSAEDRARDHASRDAAWEAAEWEMDYSAPEPVAQDAPELESAVSGPE